MSWPMINRLIELSLKNRFIVLALYVGLAGSGWWALQATPIDAIPDLSDNQVIVFTDWAGHGPQEVEDQATRIGPCTSRAGQHPATRGEHGGRGGATSRGRSPAAGRQGGGGSGDTQTAARHACWRTC